MYSRVKEWDWERGLEYVAGLRDRRGDHSNNCSYRAQGQCGRMQYLAMQEGGGG